VPHALAVNSSRRRYTSRCSDWGRAGDEVVTTPSALRARPTPMHVGATPVFADVEPDTLNLDPASVASA